MMDSVLIPNIDDHIDNGQSLALVILQAPGKPAVTRAVTVSPETTPVDLMTLVRQDYFGILGSFLRSFVYKLRLMVPKVSTVLVHINPSPAINGHQASIELQGDDLLLTTAFRKPSALSTVYRQLFFTHIDSALDGARHLPSKAIFVRLEVNEQAVKTARALAFLGLSVGLHFMDVGN